VWSKSLPIAHRDILDASHRHIVPEARIKTILINDKINNFFQKLGIKKFDIWNEGLGWLAFRLIRPGMRDGYPFSRKAWGPASNVISAWVPIIGHSPRETLTVVPNSHLKEYKKYLPLGDKFMKNEYRLLMKSIDLDCYSPRLKKGEIILYHPKMLHTEDVISSDVTRLNLEFRLNPEI